MAALRVRATRHDPTSSYVLEVSSSVHSKIDLDVSLAVCPTDPGYLEYAKETIGRLGPDDTLTVFVLGGTNPKVLPRTSMDARGQIVANAVVSALEPNDYVHLWDGLHACLRYAEIERPAIPGRLSIVALVASGRRTACPLDGEREELRKYLYNAARNPCKLVVAPMLQTESARLMYDLGMRHDRSGNEFADTPGELGRILDKARTICARHAVIHVVPRMSFEAEQVHAEGFPRDLLFGHRDLSQEIVLGDVCATTRRNAHVCLPEGLRLEDHMDVLLDYVDPATGKHQKSLERVF